ncbi:hypothetical protein LCGC14_1728070, partial [marine sediment metagenome]
MNAVDAIGMALTPGTVFNQQNKVFRSAKALAQFANVDQGEVLALVADNLAERVTIRPSTKRPENGPLIALTEFIPQQPEEAVLVKIVGGNAVEPGGLGEEADYNIEPGAKVPEVNFGGLGDLPGGGAQALMAKVEEIADENILE